MGAATAKAITVTSREQDTIVLTSYMPRRGNHPSVQSVFHSTWETKVHASPMSDSTMAMLITTEVSAAPASRMRAARSLRRRPGSPRRSATLSGPGSVVTVDMLGRVLLNEASGGRGAGGGARGIGRAHV